MISEKSPERYIFVTDKLFKPKSRAAAMGDSKAILIAAIAVMAILVVAAGYQTILLADMTVRASAGAITLKPAGGLAERKSASAYSAPPAASATTNGGGC